MELRYVFVYDDFLGLNKRKSARLNVDNETSATDLSVFSLFSYEGVREASSDLYVCEDSDGTITPPRFLEPRLILPAPSAIFTFLLSPSSLITKLHFTSRLSWSFYAAAPLSP